MSHTTTTTVAAPGRIARSREDRTAPVLPAPTDWCLTADALAALAWADGADLAAHVGDEDLAALYAAHDARHRGTLAWIVCDTSTGGDL